MSPPFTMYEGTVDVDFEYKNGFLQTTMDIGPNTDPHTFAYMPRVDQVLFPVLLIEGVPAQNFGGLIMFEFTMGDDGKASGFQARLPEDKLWLTGTRN